MSSLSNWDPVLMRRSLNVFIVRVVNHMRSKQSQKVGLYLHDHLKIYSLIYVHHDSLMTTSFVQ